MLIIFLSCIGMLALGSSAFASTRVAIVGDSTVSNYSAERPNRGWGQILQTYALPGAEIKNLAASGTSSKTFRDLGRWDEALAFQPTFILIQFGHNDRSADPAKGGTRPDTEFKENLRQFIAEARKAGAEPILVTPPVPRSFDRKTGQLGDGRLAPYVEAIKAVAAEQGSVVLDLNTRSREWYAALGREGSDAFAPKPGDVNHYNEAGATMLAQFVLEEMAAKAPNLAGLFHQPKTEP